MIEKYILITKDHDGKDCYLRINFERRCGNLTVAECLALNEAAKRTCEVDS